MKDWFSYCLPPIDFGWENLKTVEDTAEEIGSTYARERAAYGVATGLDLNEFLENWESAQDAARAEGWEGDFRHKPVVFWLPAGDGFSYGFAFKQDNNGETFVVSPVELPHLARST